MLKILNILLLQIIFLIKLLAILEFFIGIFEIFAFLNHVACRIVCFGGNVRKYLKLFLFQISSLLNPIILFEILCKSVMPQVRDSCR